MNMSPPIPAVTAIRGFASSIAALNRSCRRRCGRRTRQFRGVLLPNLKVNMFKNKTIFASTLSDQFKISSRWRKAQAKRLTHDARNAEASQRLLELESQIVISDNVWEQLAPLISDPVCLAAISDTNRDVAFRKNPRDFAAWLENLHANSSIGTSRSLETLVPV